MSTEPDAGAEHPAAQLFLQAARRIVRDFDPVPTGDLPALNQLCRLVEGMPLALELAAAWVNLLTLPEIVAEIQNRLDFLAADLQDRPVRQRSIQAVFASAWAQLSSDEQRVFARLSVCRGGFSRAAAQAIGGASLRDLSSFCDRALLSFDQVSRRYTCHELLRQFAAEQLAVIGEAEAAAALHATYFLEAMAARSDALEGPDQLKAVNEITADFENVRQAWSWAVAQKKFSIMGPMLDSLGMFLRWQGHSQAGVALFGQIPGQLTEKLSENDIIAILTGQIWLAVFEKEVANSAEAEKRLGQILPNIQRHVVTENERDALLASWHLRRGEIAIDRDYSAADHHLREGLNLFYKAEHISGIAQATGLLGETEWRLGAYDEAIKTLEKCLEIRRAQSNWREIAKATDLLGSVHRTAGSGELAAASASECMASYRRLHDRLGIARAESNLARTLAIYDGQLKSAITLLQGSIATFAELHEWQAHCYNLGTLGMLFSWLGDMETAMLIERQALEEAVEVGNRHAQAYALLNLGLRRADRESRLHIIGSIRHYRETGVVDSVATSIAWLTSCELNIGEQVNATRRVMTLLAFSNMHTLYFTLVLTMPVAVLILVLDKNEQAQDQVRTIALETLGALRDLGALRAILKHFDVYQSVRDWENQQPDELVGAASETGRNRGIWKQAERLLEVLPELGWPEPYADIETLFAAVEEDIRLEDERLGAEYAELTQKTGGTA